MHASIPDDFTGTAVIFLELAEEAAGEASALAAHAGTWARAVQIGLLGSPSSRLKGAFETQGRVVAGRFRCEQVPSDAFQVLAAMIGFFSHVKGRIEEFSVQHDGVNVVPAGGPSAPALPLSMPFAVEYPEDLKRYVRIEIEFVHPLAPSERDAIFDALSVWDWLIEVLTGPLVGEASEYHTRLLSPAIIEHEVQGYSAGLECLRYVLRMGLRLHRRLPVERITIE